MRDPGFVVSAIAERSGLDERASDRALRVTLVALSDVLSARESYALAVALREPSGSPLLLRSGRVATMPAAATVDERVTELTGMSRPRAREQTSAICGVLAEAIDADVLAALRPSLPAGVAELLVVRERPARPITPAREGGGHTLATGRPGSAHPLSEARASAGVHPHSVAANDEPHSDTKLSTTRGLTQEQLGESLADGRSGSTEPLHSARSRTRR